MARITAGSNAGSHQKSGNLHVCFGNKREVDFSFLGQLQGSFELCFQLMNYFAEATFERRRDLSVKYKNRTVSDMT